MVEYVKNKSRIAGFTVATKRKWKVNSNKRELQKICDKTLKVNLNKVRKVLEETETYYLNEYGLSVQSNNKRVNSVGGDSKYMFARVEGLCTTKKELIYAWAIKNENGEFGCANFGTRYDFDKIIMRTLKTKIL